MAIPVLAETPRGGCAHPYCASSGNIYRVRLWNRAEACMPSRLLGRDIGIVLAAKAFLLGLLFVFFFASPVANDAAQTGARILGGG